MYLKSYQFDQTLKRCREKVFFKKQQKTSDEPKQSLQSHAKYDVTPSFWGGFPGQKSHILERIFTFVAFMVKF